VETKRDCSNEEQIQCFWWIDFLKQQLNFLKRQQFDNVSVDAASATRVIHRRQTEL
jgi:hypothetical protein